MHLQYARVEWARSGATSGSPHGCPCCHTVGISCRHVGRACPDPGAQRVGSCLQQRPRGGCLSYKDDAHPGTLGLVWRPPVRSFRYTHLHHAHWLHKLESTVSSLVTSPSLVFHFARVSDFMPTFCCPRDPTCRIDLSKIKCMWHKLAHRARYLHVIYRYC
jgi:hypothetical protein